MFFLRFKEANSSNSDSGDESLETIVRQRVGNQPCLSYSSSTDSPAQFFQILHALQEQGGRLEPSSLSPMTIEMQKCDKCSREFCSTISYRRHLRLHRRKVNLDKDSATKIRGLLQAFWDKLSVEEAVKIMSFDDVSLEEVSGPSIIKALTLFIRKPGYTSMPLSYVKSGSILLDIVQGSSLRFPISSQELFSILDDASENTFLCSGMAESLQKFVFDGDAGKIGLETRNLVACTSFLIEQKLVKACLADKDAEALRYQKLLVEEEVAAQNRQAVLLEKKRLKKLRQKDRREKELTNGKVQDSLKESIPSPPSSIPADDHDSTREMLEIPFDATPSPEPSQLLNVEGNTDKDRENKYPDFGAPPRSIHSDDHDSTREILEIPFVAAPSPEPSQLVNVDGNTDKDQENRHPDFGAHQKGCRGLGAFRNFEHRTLRQGGQRQVINSHWQATKSHRIPTDSHTSHNHQAPKADVCKQRASSRNTHTSANSPEVWIPKQQSESHQGSSKTSLLVDEPKLLCQEKRLLIGSIPIPLGNRIIQGQDGSFGGNGGQLPINNSRGASGVGDVPRNDSDVAHLKCVVDGTSDGCEDEFDLCLEDGHQSDLKFLSHVAEAFLSQRWKEAMATDHVELVLLPEEPPRHSEAQDVNNEAVLSSKVDERNVLSSTDNLLPVSTTTVAQFFCSSET